MLEQLPKIKFTAKTFASANIPSVIAKVKEINDEYLYWDKVKYKKVDDLTPLQLWAVIKLSREFNYKSILFGRQKFNFVITDYLQKTLHYLDMNIGGYRDAKKLIPENDTNLLLVSSIMEEAIASSVIEGANTTRKVAKEMLRREVKPRSKSEQMIVNNYRTIKHITQNRNDDLTPENLLFIHSLVSENTLNNKKEEGYFRQTDDVHVVNHIDGEIIYTPPKQTELDILISDLCRFFNEDKDDDFIHPIIKGIIIHFMIGYIHPFTDGNGRTARALFYWYLLKQGYWLTEYLSISRIIQDTKTQYEKAYLYTESDNRDLSYFLTYNIKVVHKALEALREYINKKQKESTQLADFIKIPNINERQAQILKILNEKPEYIFTIKEVENRFVVSNYTARTDLNTLVSLGFLEVIQVNKIKQNFIRASNFSNILEALSS